MHTMRSSSAAATTGWFAPRISPESGSRRWYWKPPRRPQPAALAGLGHGRVRNQRGRRAARPPGLLRCDLLLDDNVGELLATLRTFGLAEDTIVILTADHGELPGERGLWYKMHLFERAMRVPLIVHAPGRFPRRRVAAPVSLIDLLPTTVDLGWPAAGTADLEHDGDGRSLVPLLEGLDGEERDALAEYLAEGALAPILMIRWGAHKFIWSEPDAPLLFDLEQRTGRARQSGCAPGARGASAGVGGRAAPPLRPASAPSGNSRQPEDPAPGMEGPRAGPQGALGMEPRAASRGYVSGEADLNVLEHSRRYPPPE
jgi:choline-sulfatase